IYASMVVLSVLVIFQAAQPGASIWSDCAQCAFSLSIALNTTIVLIIVARILWHRFKVGHAPSDLSSKQYFSIVAILVESAALYAITGIIYISCFARGISNVQNLVLGILSQVSYIASELIILRLVLGSAWSLET
ncbi:hypothetical protein M422DRAFT_103228, partial [Sphaerobolus stellatus SS14]